MVGYFYILLKRFLTDPISVRYSVDNNVAASHYMLVMIWADATTVFEISCFGKCTDKRCRYLGLGCLDRSAHVGPNV